MQRKKNRDQNISCNSLDTEDMGDIFLVNLIPMQIFFNEDFITKGKGRGRERERDLKARFFQWWMINITQKHSQQATVRIFCA